MGAAMSEEICTNKSEAYKTNDLINVNKYYCVEMKPVKTLPIYQFKLHLQSNLDGAYVLIKDQSEILKYLKSGEKVDMLYHPKKANAPAVNLRTRILTISKNEKGPLKGHFKVGLSIES
jgi:hypothetical protein